MAYKLFMSGDSSPFFSCITESELRHCLVNDVADIMQHNFNGNEEYYSFQMCEWSKMIPHLVSDSIDSDWYKTYLHDMGYVLEVSILSIKEDK